MSQPDTTRARPFRAYLPARPVGLRVEAILGKKWGVTEGTAHQYLLTLAKKVADVCEAMIAVQQYDRVITYLTPIHNVVEVPLQNGACLRDLIQKAQDSDSEEEKAETRYLASPTPENAKAWARCLATCEHDSRQLRLALYRDREVVA
jgi:hypothetical protein